jgi:hypothetical protein
MDQNITRDFALTIKRYNIGGLSQLVHEDADAKKHQFAIKGPMGKGLELKSGRSVAFAAGTGMLVFVDLIAHLILKKVAERGGPNLLQDNNSLPDNFQLELYTSFYNEDEAVGLTLVKALESMYAAESPGGNSPFVHVGRLDAIPEQKAILWNE